MKTICVFAGSSKGNDPVYVEMADRIGAMIAARGLEIVYGGGRTGLMGAIADGATENDGQVHGIIPRFLDTLEIAHQGISKLTITETMHERKTIMYESSDAFLALPGGYGTMEEVLEIITWRQLKVHDKPICLFNPNGFWDHLMTMFHVSSEAGFIRPNQLNLVDSLDSMDALADHLDHLTKGA
ncbi:MAG: TIGR00730 family Rossman fold protein [Alphaproteobacteria bacterium]|nr:TIGR00730 family Rossman fold protein [Alphaproteobacteria bacterium]